MLAAEVLAERAPQLGLPVDTLSLLPLEQQARAIHQVLIEDVKSHEEVLERAKAAVDSLPTDQTERSGNG